MRIGRVDATSEEQSVHSFVENRFGKIVKILLESVKVAPKSAREQPQLKKGKVGTYNEQTL